MKRPTITPSGLQVSFAGVPAWRLGGVYEVKRMPRGVKRAPKVINGITLWKCNACGNWKTVAEYSPDRRRFNGLQGICKVCRGQAEAARRARDPERFRREKREYYASNREECRRLSRERYAQHSKQLKAWQKQYRINNPEKIKAISAVKAALRRGELVKPSHCEMCGVKDGRLHGHHEVYTRDRWLCVIWLCAACHQWVHVQQRILQRNARQPQPTRVRSSSATQKRTRRRKA